MSTFIAMRKDWKDGVDLVWTDLRNTYEKKEDIPEDDFVRYSNNLIAEINILCIKDKIMRIKLEKTWQR